MTGVKKEKTPNKNRSGRKRSKSILQITKTVAKAQRLDVLKIELGPQLHYMFTICIQSGYTHVLSGR